LLRLVDITNISASSISFRTPEIPDENYIPYVLYDTSTGIAGMEDYYGWRTTTTKTSTGATVVDFTISNSNKYPSYSSDVTAYTSLSPKYLHVVSLLEYQMIQQMLTRIDMVRKRLPNPGVSVTGDSGYGEDGVVSHAGGFEKKFTIAEIMQFIEGALVEVNIHPPATAFYWTYTTVEKEQIANPYILHENGVPYKMIDLVLQGAVIRALIAWGILEVDIHFTTSDNGLQITYDRVNYISSWFDRLLQNFDKQKDFIKWDCVNSYGYGVGSVAYAATGLVAQAAGMISANGVLPMNSLMGFSSRANFPM